MKLLNGYVICYCSLLFANVNIILHSTVLYKNNLLFLSIVIKTICINRSKCYQKDDKNASKINQDRSLEFLLRKMRRSAERQEQQDYDQV